MIAKKITGGLLAATLALGASGTLIIPANANEVGKSPAAFPQIGMLASAPLMFHIPTVEHGNMEPPCGADVEMSTPISSTIPVGIIPRF